jgi:hypothetical protein
VEEKFPDIAVRFCPKLGPNTAHMIWAEVRKNSKDVRDVVSLGKLIHKSDGPDEIEAIMRT